MPTGLAGGTGSARRLLGLLPLQAEDFPLDHLKDERVDVTRALVGNGTSIAARQELLRLPGVRVRVSRLAGPGPGLRQLEHHR